MRKKLKMRLYEMLDIFLISMYSSSFKFYLVNIFTFAEYKWTKWGFTKNCN